MNHGIKSWLNQANGLVFCLYTILAAFGTYSCMYAFRKPFAVATFADYELLGVDYKIWLITAQVIGYTTSKFLGIKVVSELKKQARAISTIVLVVIAELALLGFAITPAPFNILFLFLNGLPLGMVWGIVFSYLEGRRYTEVLGAGLCVSFIFSSGFVKSIGKWLMLEFNVGPFWMPFTTGLIFLIPLIVFQILLDQTPEPNQDDIAQRTERVPMNGWSRVEMIKRFGPGLFVLVLTYMALTAFRDFRDNFAAEIWTSLGYGASPGIFTYTEIPIALGVLVIMSLVMLIKNNLHALMANHLIIVTGFFLLGFGTVLFNNAVIGPVAWMTMVGFGLYLGYVPFNSIFFDRLIAAFRSAGNVGFLIYLADSFGYLGSVGVMFYKNFGHPNITWLTFFKNGAIVVGFIGIISTIVSMLYFYFIHKKNVQSGKPGFKIILKKHKVNNFIFETQNNKTLEK